MALIEIDGLPINSMVIFHDFPWQTVNVITCHNQMVTSVGSSHHRSVKITGIFFYHHYGTLWVSLKSQVWN